MIPSARLVDRLGRLCNVNIIRHASAVRSALRSAALVLLLLACAGGTAHAQGGEKRFEDSIRVWLRGMLPRPETYVAKSYAHSVITRGAFFDMQIARLKTGYDAERKAFARDSVALLNSVIALSRIDSASSPAAWRKAFAKVGAARAVHEKHVAMLKAYLKRFAELRTQRNSDTLTRMYGYSIRHTFSAQDKTGQARESTFDFIISLEGKLYDASEVRTRSKAPAGKK